MFKDNIYQEALNTQGFTLMPLLEDREIVALKDLYLKNFNDGNISGMFATHNRNNAELSKFLSEEIIRITKTSLDKQFSDYQLFLAHYVVKSPNSENEFALHQDWNIVDEEHFKSYHIWIPLSFTSPNNGGMFVLPRSHRYFKNHRSGSFGTPSIASKDLAKGMLMDLNIPPSHALVWHDATFHGSHPNTTDEKRISVVLVVHEKSAVLEYANFNNEKECLETYPIKANDLLENLEILEKGLTPTGWKPSLSVPYSQFPNDAVDASYLIDKWKSFQDEPQTNLPIFRSKDMQLEMESNGFVVQPFLNEGELIKARELLKDNSAYSQHIERPRYTSLELEDGNSKLVIHQELLQLFTRALNQFFKNYKSPIFQFFIKNPKSDGEVGLHTDSSLLLNPLLEAHYGIWIPLVDVDENNGGLIIVQHSHGWFNGFLASSYSWPFFPYLKSLEKNAKQLTLRAGDVVIFDNRMIHGSSFNKSDQARFAVAGRVTHKYASYYSFLQEKEGFISVFEEADDIYLNADFKGDRMSAKDGKKVGEARQPILNKEIFNGNE